MKNGLLHRDVARPTSASKSRIADGAVVFGEMMNEIATLTPVNMCTGRYHHISLGRAFLIFFELKKKDARPETTAAFLTSEWRPKLYTSADSESRSGIQIM